MRHYESLNQCETLQVFLNFLNYGDTDSWRQLVTRPTCQLSVGYLLLQVLDDNNEPSVNCQLKQTHTTQNTHTVFQ